MASRSGSGLPAWVALVLLFIFFVTWLGIAYFAGWDLPTTPFGELK